MSSFKSAQNPGETSSQNGSAQKCFRGLSTLLLPPLAWHSEQGNLGLDSL